VQIAFGREACADEALQRAQGVFHDVVLVVSFADDAAARSSAAFFRSIYSRMFLAVVVSAPKEDAALGIEGELPCPLNRLPFH